MAKPLYQPTQDTRLAGLRRDVEMLKRRQQAGITVEDEGVDLPPRSTLNFVGAGVTATDDGTAKTVVTIPGGGGGGIQFDTQPQAGGFLFASVTGTGDSGGWGVELSDTTNTHGIYLHQGALSSYSALTLHDYGGGGALFVDCQQALFNCGVDFVVRNAGAVNSLFRIEANGTIHGRASVGAIVWDL